MKRFIVASFLVFPLLLSSFAQKEEIQYPALAKELIQMRAVDQKYRIRYGKMIQKGKRDTEKFKTLVYKLIDIDRSNTARMQEIVAQYGWPTYDKVGRRGSNAAWILVQHADRNPVFQIQCLPLLKAAVDEGQASTVDYAYLYDRVQLAQGYKQKYATQSTTHPISNEPFFQALEDEAKVQQNREAMGIKRTVVEYAESLGFDYSIPTLAEAEQRAQQFAATYTENIQAARAAMKKGDYQTAADHYILATACDGYTQMEDYVETARAMALAKHKRSHRGFAYLIKAGLRGWEGIFEVDSNPEFAYLKAASPKNWQDLMIVVEALQRESP
ncbi:MAG: DUF6624 domain-containing protein [Bacteroidota bacterium]